MRQPVAPNFERQTSRSACAHAVGRLRFGLNSKRAHPPYPPRVRRQLAATRELKARARFEFALEVRGDGSFPADSARRGPREQREGDKEFVCAVRARCGPVAGLVHRPAKDATWANVGGPVANGRRGGGL
jgi:hypothetical protein